MLKRIIRKLLQIAVLGFGLGLIGTALSRKLVTDPVTLELSPLGAVFLVGTLLSAAALLLAYFDEDEPTCKP